MNNNTKILLKILSDGALHSGESLGKQLGLTRGAIWKLIKQLINNYGIAIEAKTKQGYRIPGGIEFLDKEIINKYLNPEYKSFAQNTVIFDEVDSTNTYLAQDASANICLAESQSAGKGRLGRKWFSPYASNIYLSLRWNFTKNLVALDGLSLALGIAITRALVEYGITTGIALKWPNDILWQKQKLAGVLIELSGEMHETYQTIIGIGINADMSKQLAPDISQPWCDIAQIIRSKPERNKIIGLLLNHVYAALIIFQDQGLKPFLAEWQKLDITYGKKITLTASQKQIIRGISLGINDHGYLLLKDNDEQIHEFNIGEVSLRIEN